MIEIEITNDFDKMEAIGHTIMLEKQSIYTPLMVDSLRSSIRTHLPNIGENEIDRRMYRAVYNYWVYGNNVDEDFYFDFDHKDDLQKREFMTMRTRLNYIYHLNNKEKAYLFNNKYETYKLFGQYYLREMIKITSEADFECFSGFVKKHPTFVVKPCSMGLGIGVHKVSITPGDDLKKVFEDLLDEGNRNSSSYTWNKDSSLILEELIIQHESLSRLHPESVNGVRITTVRVNGEVHIYHPWIKIGCGGSFIASAALGGFDVGIDPVTGICITDGIGELGEKYLNHPNTGCVFKGYVIPNWEELIQMAKTLANELPDDVNYIGWDFVLTDRGWCIMEANFAGDFMWQVLYGKGMREEFENLIGWKSEKNFWWQ